jgi:2-succinyl-6-hydroxy-2,4-cyclohexadiene-1-carboxylate synthase
VVLVGYSLGGRLALHLAARHPERIARLLLVGASAGLETESARAERRESDARWARLLRENGLEAFFRAWEAQPLFASLAELDAPGRARLEAARAGHDAEGLAWSLEAFGLGAQQPLHDALPALAVPTVWAAGARDAKFSALAAELAGRMPNARAEIVPGAGHNLPLERPAAFRSLVASLLPPLGSPVACS